MKSAEAVLPHNSPLVDCVQNSIPKRIIQTGKNSEHSLRTRAMLGTIKNLNPDYEYLFFDDRDVGAFIDQGISAVS